MKGSAMYIELLSYSPQKQLYPKPLLFVHDMWHGAWCWQEYFLPYFAEQGFEAHALSLRGHGKSEGSGKLRRTSVADYVQDVLQAVEQLAQSPVLLGHSMGGMIVQKFLETHPEIPAAVLLASGPPSGLFSATLRTLKSEPLSFLKANLTLSLYPVIDSPAKARKMFFSPDFARENLNRYFNLLQDESYRAYMDLLLFNLPKPKKVTAPLLVLGAENDAVISKKNVRATARAYGAQAVFIPNTAHDMMLEKTWQKTADTIIEWLKEKKV